MPHVIGSPKRIITHKYEKVKEIKKYIDKDKMEAYNLNHKMISVS